MAYNRFRRKEKHRRQYTFTKSKAAVGFVLSAFFSILLSSYFEKYGAKMYHATVDYLSGVSQAVAQSEQYNTMRERYEQHQSKTGGRVNKRTDSR